MQTQSSARYSNNSVNAKDISELSLYLKALPRLADKGKDKRIKRAKDDFLTFIKTYFPNHIKGAKTDSSHFRKFVHKNIE
ncbi:hypothetical protein [Abyssogena phaseoliformis symbiont]|uniref:hypothetical protein n=1 Tax=Abyssogena phaseoliformis symbiont TaxID=596095 RepID=UPI0019168A62|nr:hypothetical protein [Abyssogena phaseoliformis symbiont]